MKKSASQAKGAAKRTKRSAGSQQRRDRDVEALKACCKAIESCSCREMIKGTLDFLNSKYGPPGSASEREIAYNLLHPGFQRTYWVNLYPTGEMTSTLCATESEALNRCTYTGETPDAMQVEIRIVPLTPNAQAEPLPPDGERGRH